MALYIMYPDVLPYLKYIIQYFGPLPVWHAHNNILHSILTGFVDDSFECRNERLGSLQAKAFL